MSAEAVSPITTYFRVCNEHRRPAAPQSSTRIRRSVGCEAAIDPELVPGVT
jgi:hypothetical protein